MAIEFIEETEDTAQAPSGIEFIDDDRKADIPTAQTFVDRLKEGNARSPKQRAKMLFEGVDPRNISNQKLGKLITAAQIGIGFTPVGRLGKIGAAAITSGAEAVGEFAQSQLKGDTVDESLKKASRAGAVSGLIDAALYPGASKLLKATVGKKFSKNIVNAIEKNPKLLKEPKKSLDEISERGFEAISNLRTSKGTLVGEANELALSKNPEVKIDPVIDFFEDARKKARLTVEAGEEAVEEGVKGRRALTKVEDLLTKPGKQDFKTLDARLKSLDNFLSERGIFTKKAGERTAGENIALRTRGKLSELLNQSIEDVAIKGKVKGAKKGFKDLLDTLNSQAGRAATRSEDSLSTLIKSSLKEGKGRSFKDLKKLDDLLPKDKKFLDDAIASQVGPSIGKLGSSLKGAATGLAEIGAKRVVSPGVRTAARRGSVELAAEPGEALKSTRSVVTPSLNAIMYGGRALF